MVIMTVIYKTTEDSDKMLNIETTETILNIAVQESDENSSPVHNVNNNADLSVDTHLNNNADDSDSPQANSELQTPSSATVVDEETELRFPEAELERLDDMVNRTRWIVPVLPGGELEILLDASIALAAKGLDEQCEPCQKFYRDGLTQSFTKIMTDDAVSGWKYEIHRAIYRNCFKLVKLAYLKLHQDAYVIFELLAMVFNQDCKFHSFNETRIREQPQDDEDLPHTESDFTYAQLGQEVRSGGLWLVDLINYFGKLGGFDRVQERFNHMASLSLATIAALIKPFGNCHEILTQETIQKYFSGTIHDISVYLDNLSDSDLKKENKANDPKSDNIVCIIRSAQTLLRHLPEQEENLAKWDFYRLRFILRVLQVASFSGKMNALNDLNRIINNTGYFHHRQHFRDNDATEYLTADQVANWINKNNVLAIALRENLHQPQYVEKLEKILRFMIKEKTLSTADLDLIWDAQVGKHEVIVSNVHDLLARLAWDFSAEQLDHVFQCFQKSYSTASSRRERERLLELARRLAEEDKEGVMAQKVLGLLWGLTNNDECPSEIMEQALVAHIKILDYNCSQDRESTKIEWINRIVKEVKQNVKWVLPALKQIRDICSLFTESSKAYSHTHYPPRLNQAVYRTHVVKQLQSEHEIIDVVCQNLADYMERASDVAKSHPELNPAEICLDGRFSHHQHVTERLKFLRFVLKEGDLRLKEAQAVQLWKSLAENAIFPSDREACFKWFSKWVGIDTDKESSKACKSFFENQILRLDPVLLTENGINCFEKFFRAVNVNERYLSVSHGEYRMEEVNLHGVEYLWRTVLHANDDVAERATRLLKETFTLLGANLLSQQTSIHEDFIQQCDCRLKADLDTLTLIKDDDNSSDAKMEHANRMMRVLTVLREYLAECDERFIGERRFLPLCRSWRGRNFQVTIRFTCQVRQSSDDLPVTTHTNETMGCLRSRVLRLRIGSNGAASNYRLHLFANSDLIEAIEDRRVVTHFGLNKLSLLSAQLVPLAGQSMATGSHIPSSPESTSGSSLGGSPKLMCSSSGQTGGAEQRAAATGESGSQHNQQGIGSNDRSVDDAENSVMTGETALPGVMMSRDRTHAPFLFRVAQLASCVNCAGLRDVALDVLELMPPDQGIVQRLRSLITNPETTCESWKNTLFSQCEPPEVAYLLQTLYCLLMPALESNWYASSEQNNVILMEKFVTSGGVQALLSAFRENFIEDADTVTRRSACLWIVRILKVSLCAVGFGCIKFLVSKEESEGGPVMDAKMKETIQAAGRVMENLQSSGMSGPTSDVFVQHIAKKVGDVLTAEQCVSNFPDLPVVISIMKMVWSASIGSMHLLREESLENIHKEVEKSASDIGCPLQVDDVSLAYDGLECMTLCLCLCSQAAEQLRTAKDRHWQSFIHDMVLLCPNRDIRSVARDQFWLMAGLCASDRNTTIFFVQLLFIFLNVNVKAQAHQSAEFFSLLERLLEFVNRSQIHLPNAEALMNNEIQWLKKSRTDALESGEPEIVDQLLLEGHLKVLKELVHLQSSGRKYFVGSEKGGPSLIKELLEDFLFPASRLHLRLAVSTGSEQTGDEREVNPVCVSPAAVSAAFELLVTLTMGCYQNMRVLAMMLTEMYYANHSMTLVEWDYLPPVGPRSSDGFVGLKNAGATCYMNSVLQQLFMIIPIRNAILTCDSTVIAGMESGPTSPALPPPHLEEDVPEKENEEFGESAISKDLRGDHNVAILRHVQVIFGHLAYSKQQFYIPKGFWKQFKLWGEHVNLREQHDALEFFNCLVDNIDEGLKKLGQAKVVERVMGGSFEDQKICKDCPHRYSREETFIILNVDIRNHHNLAESLEQYVKGDLLEGDNAYHCEECDKKVNTVKRMCIKKLPPILAIQLKRFDYDWDREVAVKFNDYFEFPRELDMDPYTARGLARIEGDTAAVVAADADRGEGDPEPCSKFRLKGVVVHSGQASGGHYYSYIRHKRDDGSDMWYKFDDNEVSECHMEDDEEMRNQCFGGEYMGEVYDHMIKRMAYRKQKRWWNAYILFYERYDFQSEPIIAELQTSLSALSLKDSRLSPRLPNSIKKMVRQDNIHFMHTKAQFSPEYFTFMKRLTQCHAQEASRRVQTNDVNQDFENLVITLLELTSRFLFSVGWRTKKALRGPASDWNDPLLCLLKISPGVRQSFAACFFCNSQTRISEYLLECQSSEVRATYAKLFVWCAHLSLNDGPCPPRIVANIYGKTPFDRNLCLSEHLMRAALNLLLRKEVCEYGRHLNQYFQLFHLYLSQGNAERQHLLRLNVPLEFIRLAIEDKAYPPMKYQIVEMNKLYLVVSELLLCYDVSRQCKTSENQPPRTHNPYQQKALMLMPPDLVRFCYAVDPSSSQQAPKLVKKFVEDAAALPEVITLMKFLSWENIRFSAHLLYQLIWLIFYGYVSELRPYFDLFADIVMLPDSWQEQRVLCALTGAEPFSMEGLFDVIHRLRGHHHKRVYQCLKMVTWLFENCQPARTVLHREEMVRRAYTNSIEWLNDELDKRVTQNYYGQWSTPATAQSNELSNGYYLERSQSAQLLLQKAASLLPELGDEEEEDEEEEEEEEEDEVMTTDDKGFSKARDASPHNRDDVNVEEEEDDQEDDDEEEGIEMEGEISLTSPVPLIPSAIPPTSSGSIKTSGLAPLSTAVMPTTTTEEPSTVTHSVEEADDVRESGTDSNNSGGNGSLKKVNLDVKMTQF